MDFHQALIAEFEDELAITRKMLAAIPADADFTHRPHPKSFTLGRLAGHVAETPTEWALSTLTTDHFAWTEGDKPLSMTNKDETLAAFDQKAEAAKTALRSLDPEKWSGNWKMTAGDQTWINDTRYNVWRKWVLNHTIHHRAQLGLQLRLLNVPIPGTYGPSADEM